MLVEALILGVIVGFIQSRKVIKRDTVELKLTYLPLVAFGLEIICQKLLSAGILFNEVNIGIYTFVIQIAVYGILFAFIGFNINFKGIKLFLLGTIMNFSVIVVNFGNMPVDGAVLEKFGYINALNKLTSGKIFAHAIITESTKLKVLSDVINITPPYPFPKSISIGDIIMAIGIAIMAAALARSYKNQEEPETM